MTERDGEVATRRPAPPKGATARRTASGGRAIGAGSPEDVGQTTFAATTDSLQQTVGRTGPRAAATFSRPSTTTTRRTRSS